MHRDPTYTEQEVVHYCVANMPGAVARTSTLALNNATLPFVINIAEQGVKASLLAAPHLLNGLNIFDGKLVSPEVAHSQKRNVSNRKDLLEQTS